MTLCRVEHYDLVIVGAGMVGASLACILENTTFERPLNILLVESAAIDLQAAPAQPSFDARSTVLSYGTVAYFQTLGFWDELVKNAEAITDIHVSDQGKFGSVRMNHKEQGVDALGYVIENRLLGNMFNSSLLAAENLEICSAVSVTGINPLTAAMQIFLTKGSDQTAITAELVVLAEGGRSGLCEKLGIHRHHHSYNQEAIIANVAFSKAHNNVAYERFTRHGPLALLPLPAMVGEQDGEHRAALVWTRTGNEVSSLLDLSDEDFLRQLQKEFGNRLGEFTRVGQRNSYPLSLVAAEEQVRPGLVLLGNVAHALHPVAGQGFNLAFRDTMRLSAILIEAANSGASLGDIKRLHRFRDDAAADQDKTTAFSHYMTRLFSTDNSAAVWARKFGLFSIDLILPLRKAFVRSAMGLADSRIKLDKPAL